MIDTNDRHPGTQQLARWLVANPSLPTGGPREIAQFVEAVAAHVIERTPDGPELTAGLRKLLEAKDCFVRAVLPS